MGLPTSPTASSRSPNTATPIHNVCMPQPTISTGIPVNVCPTTTCTTDAQVDDSERWKPPASVLGGMLYSLLCLIAFGYSSMDRIRDNLHNSNKKPWEKGVRQMYDRLNNIIVVAGLLLATAAVFITTPPPEGSMLNYTRRGPYICIMGSFGLLVGGVIVGSSVLLVLARLQREWMLNVFCADRFRIFCTLIMLAYPVVSVAVATLLLAFGLLSAVWCAEDVGIKGASVIILILPCTMATIFAVVCCARGNKMHAGISMKEKDNDSDASPV
ncbi:hypothetical protein CYLTODRAFT_491171 [Cylindrobasidium torrendii FP15055 ss-10]|uniref:Uncharacterized protein n=1 Tax=Cylindrobasidium torrendii FP15055 ss-10 TaxID=1314674 RepID=A0A0D7B9E2_9AGAR|nr:hypothetical protein CYLTODRAFT_491171 [Cylindrobasidium torrendii FP15055 ss-10]